MRGIEQGKITSIVPAAPLRIFAYEPDGLVTDAAMLVVALHALIGIVRLRPAVVEGVLSACQRIRSYVR